MSTNIFHNNKTRLLCLLWYRRRNVSRNHQDNRQYMIQSRWCLQHIFRHHCKVVAASVKFVMLFPFGILARYSQSMMLGSLLEMLQNSRRHKTHVLLSLESKFDQHKNRRELRENLQITTKTLINSIFQFISLIRLQTTANIFPLLDLFIWDQWEVRDAPSPQSYKKLFSCSTFKTNFVTIFKSA